MVGRDHPAIAQVHGAGAGQIGPCCSTPGCWPALNPTSPMSSLAATTTARAEERNDPQDQPQDRTATDNNLGRVISAHERSVAWSLEGPKERRVARRPKCANPSRIVTTQPESQRSGHDLWHYQAGRFRVPEAPSEERLSAPASPVFRYGPLADSNFCQAAAGDPIGCRRRPSISSTANRRCRTRDRSACRTPAGRPRENFVYPNPQARRAKGIGQICPIAATYLALDRHVEIAHHDFWPVRIPPTTCWRFPIRATILQASRPFACRAPRQKRLFVQHRLQPRARRFTSAR